MDDGLIRSLEFQVSQGVFDEVFSEIRGRLPELMIQKHEIIKHIYPASMAAVLPARLITKHFTGTEADLMMRDVKLLNLPVIWSQDEHWGITILLLEAKDGETQTTVEE